MRRCAASSYASRGWSPKSRQHAHAASPCRHSSLADGKRRWEPETECGPPPHSKRWRCVPPDLRGSLVDAPGRPHFGNPAASHPDAPQNRYISWRPVAFRPCLATGLAFSIDQSHCSDSSRKVKSCATFGAFSRSLERNMRVFPNRQLNALRDTPSLTGHSCAAAPKRPKYEGNTAAAHVPG